MSVEHQPDLTVPQRLVASARNGGLPHLINALRQAFDAEVGLFDLGGNVIATAPTRAIWDTSAVRAAYGSPGGSISVRSVDFGGEPVALLATRSTHAHESIWSIALDLTAMELGRLHAARQGRQELAEGLLKDVLSGNLSEADAVGRLQTIGVDATRPFRVLIGSSEHPHTRPLGSIYSLMSERPEPFPRLMVGDKTLMVVPDDQMVERIAHSLHSQLQEHSNAVTVGISFAHRGGAGLRAAHHEASAALRQGPGVHHPGALDLADLLVLSNTALPLSVLARDTVQPLAEYDTNHDASLLETLREYLASDRDIIATTAKLYIHRNTLRYRLRQISALLQVDLESTATITTLRLAFLILADEQDVEE